MNSASNGNHINLSSPIKHTGHRNNKRESGQISKAPIYLCIYFYFISIYLCMYVCIFA